MNTHLRIIALVLALLLSVSPLVTAEGNNEITIDQLPFLDRLLTVEEMQFVLESIFETISDSVQEEGIQFWYSVIYNEKLDLFFVEFAIDGWAEKIYNAINAGYDETYEPWVYMKERILMLYGMLTVFFGMCENENLTLILQFQNDLQMIHDDWSIPGFYEMYEIGRNGVVIGDIMRDAKTPIPTRRPANLPTHAPIQHSKNSVASLNQDDTKDLVVAYLESNGVKIKRRLFVPLVEKDEGSYGGMERWHITLSNGEQLFAWTKDGKITYVYDGVEYSDVPLYSE